MPFPVWHCDQCGAIILADEAQLPTDPSADMPARACDCGNTELRPDPDVMDTWATSSMSPQIAAQMFENPELYRQQFPMQMRPQAHDNIRVWAFYTIVKSRRLADFLDALSDERVGWKQKLKMLARTWTK